jgi:hypothetical protein
MPFFRRSNRRLAGPDGPVEQNDALLRTVTLSCRLENTHQAHQRNVQPKHGIFAATLWVLKEVVTEDALLVVDVLLTAVRQHHVVKALESVSRHLRIFANDRQVLLERTLPRKIAVAIVVLHLCDGRDHRTV